ncbi:MAG: 4-alpha-glucanotransferase [Bacteroidetes bacterium]|nr:4-alpha-glucanotransferase [Bacteroidota bacterium]
MMNERASGILLHPTSLPGKYGIGTLGKAAFNFIDFLSKAKQQYWQILPLGPTGFGDSPYQCYSAHAGNPDLIDPDLLVSQHLLANDDLNSMPHFEEGSVDYDKVQKARLPLLIKAFHSFNEHAADLEKLAYRNFLKSHAPWLNDYALFRAVKEDSGNKPWYNWDKDLKTREPGALKEAENRLSSKIDFHKFLQFLFFKQWTSVKDYAKKHKIRIIGDIPLYISLDSSDAWANPGEFEFDGELKPIRVGGVPPDYFSETGQLWGNPLFRWDIMKHNNYKWWMDRIRTNLTLYDVIRIDHFRGFAAYWAVPYAEETAIKGEWIPGPGKDFFSALKNEFGDLPIIAEDLGVMTPDVEDLRDSFGLPGMKILEFAFDSSEANEYIPYSYNKNCIVYTGTHDNDTVVGWFKKASEDDRKQVLDYIHCDDKDIHWSFVRLAWSSVANIAIVPMQDLLGLDSEARMNLPGTTGGNWNWRAREADFPAELATALAALTSLYGRSRKSKSKTK